jgi:hypothetical protein
MGSDETASTEEPNIDTEMSSDTMTPDDSASTDIDPKVKSIQDSLQKAFANAKQLGDEKLMQQIGNTITMLVRTQVLGGQVSESLEEMLNEDNPSDKVGYLENTLEYVWEMGKNNNDIDYTSMAKSIIDALETRL